MRHKKAGRKLGRKSSHRKAMFKNMAVSLIKHERIVTTVHKAKEIAPIVERLVTRAKVNNLHNLRYIVSELQDVDAANKLFTSISPLFADVNGGYTRIIRLGGSRWADEASTRWAHNRLGDNGERVIIEFTKKTAEAETKLQEKEKKSAKVKK